MSLYQLEKYIAIKIINSFEGHKLKGETHKTREKCD